AVPRGRAFCGEHPPYGTSFLGARWPLTSPPSAVGSHIPKAAFCVLLETQKAAAALHNCSDWLSDKELLPVIAQNHQLQQIELNGCIQLSHMLWWPSLWLLADHCKELESLDSTAGQLKDEAISYLHLDLTGCLRVKNNSIRTLAEYCPKLVRGVELDVEPPFQRVLVLLQDVVGFAPFINLQI
uniref:Uncharacterized protein n=1 Tax=Naja naja TaxID=35670 RepID=A0A8C6XUZ7_NAJNA